uniref:Uncharacterized protein n=1 Tax=Plectus sambesii TaxID=2011161 RepID=A0A914XES1_9BILA
MTISTLQGGMALYGGLDSRPASNTEIISFSSLNDVISPMSVTGNIFLVQLKPGTTISLNFETSIYSLYNYVYGGSGARGLMMSENFPYLNKKEIADSFSFSGDGIDYYEYSINVLRYDLGSGSLTIKSTVLDSDFSKTLTSSGSNKAMQFCANSFKVDYTSNGINQMGFVLRYDVVSRTRVRFPLKAAPHPTKVLIPLWVGELVAAKLRIYRRQALATGRPILTSRINHGPKSHRDNGPEERTPPLYGTTA